MTQEELSKFTDEELLQKAKAMKSYQIYDAVIFGMLIGIATYSTVKNGLDLLTFLPLVYLPIAAKNKVKNKEIMVLPNNTILIMRVLCFFVILY